MYLAVSLLICAQFITRADAGDATCSVDGGRSASYRLRRQLFCDYDAKVRPVKHNNNETVVQVLMTLKSLIYYEEWNTLEVHSWSSWRWRDDHLTWDLDEFEQLTELRVSSSEIWVPDLSLWTSGDMDKMAYGLAATTCHLNNKGRVLCVSPTVHSALCISDLTRWPFDSHKCTALFGSWSEMGKGVVLNVTDTGMNMSSYTPNRDWELLQATARLRKFSSPNDTVPTVSWILYSFNMRRHSGGHAATVFMPCLVLVVFTMAIFFVDAHSPERIYLACLSVLCHCLYLLYLSAKLPSNGDKYPIILTFFRDSLLLVCVSLCVTSAVREMDAARSAPPAWIVAVTDAVLATRPGQILVGVGGDDLKLRSGEDDVTESIETLRRDERWHRFAVLLDRTVLLVFLITFIVLLCAFVP